MREKLSEKYKRNRTSAVIMFVFILVSLVIFFFHMMTERPGLHTFLLFMFVAVVAVSLYCLLDNPCTKAMKDYNLTEEMLDAEFQRAEEVKILLFCPYPCHDERKVDDILNYFSQRFPHILIGYSKEAKRMFKEEYDRFLRIKYYPGLQKQQEGIW